jgi:hypothetical protein
MRAHGREGQMGRRFAIVIGVAAVGGVMALGAQTAAAAPDVVKYETELRITHELHRTNRGVLWHGGVESEVTKCERLRRVVLFRVQSGADRKLGTTRSHENKTDWFEWWMWARQKGRVYARVTPKVRDGFVCRADRSATIGTNHRHSGWE